MSSQSDDQSNNASHEEVPNPQVSSPPPPATITPSKNHQASILDEHTSPSSPGLRNRKSMSSSDGVQLSCSRDNAEHHETSADPRSESFDENHNPLELDRDASLIITEDLQQQQQPQDTTLVTSIWRTYDDIIILSLFSIFGIVFRIFSATWFRMELGVVFSEDSALGTNLPLNCCSCFLLGLLCSGRDAIGIVYSKALGGSNPYGDGRGIFDVGRGAYRGVINAGRAGLNRARGHGILQSNIQHGEGTAIDDSTSDSTQVSGEVFDNDADVTAIIDIPSTPNGLHRRRSQTSVATARNRQQHNTPRESEAISPGSNVSDGASIAGLLGLDEEFRIGNRHHGEDEIREVQLRALTRRIMASPSLVLFPARKADIDVIEHYQSNNTSSAQNQISRDSNFILDNHFEIGELDDHLEIANGEENVITQHNSQSRTNNRISTNPGIGDMNMATLQSLYGLNFSEGWDVGTTAEEMKHQILLGLRVGFCGAVSTWSSWNSAMISLLQRGKIGEVLVGYALGIQLGVVCYRFGQQLAVYIFVFRRRRETRRDARRGYGLRLRAGTDDSSDSETMEAEAQSTSSPHTFSSIRVVATVLFAVIIILLCCTIFIFPQHQQFAISLLFTPFGCLGRYRLQRKLNRKLPGFPIGTFTCNLLSVALSGSIGSFLAGNPGPEESIVLTSMIAGFAGSLSTFAGYISEVLALIDPIIFKFDGFAYAIITVLWGAIIGFFSSQAKNWADEI